MEDKELELASQIISMPRQIICTYWEDKKINKVAIDIEKDDHILVTFEKGYVVVTNGKETKFVCKGKAFISLWN